MRWVVGQGAWLARRGSLGFGKARGKRETQQKERRKKTKTFSVFPCCTSKGRRKRNNVVQNDTVLNFFLT
jgi:hypothetical protein